MSKTVLIALRVSPEIVEKVDVLKKSRRWSRSETIRFILETYFEGITPTPVGFSPPDPPIGSTPVEVIPIKTLGDGLIGMFEDIPKRGDRLI